MNILKICSDYFRTKQRENERDLEFFESDLFNFLNCIYVQEEADELFIKAKRRLSDISFNKLNDFARQKDYIKFVSANKRYPLGYYIVTAKGVDYILSFKNTKQEAKNSSLIAWFTVVLGINAMVSIISILLHEQDTRSYIFLLLSSFIPPILKLGFFAIILIILFRIYEFIKDFRRRKKQIF